MTEAAALFSEAFSDDPRAVLDAIGGSRRIPAGEGEIVGVPTGSFAGLRGSEVGSLGAKAVAGQATNRAWRLGDRFLLKLYDRLAPGPHPELEMLGELTGIKVAPPLAGWLEYSVPGDDPSVAGVLLGWIPDATNAWDLAVEDPERIRGLVSRLARKTAEMHLRLEDVTGPSFLREPLDREYLRTIFSSMVRLAEEVLGGSGGEAADLLPAARDCFDRVPALRPGGTRIRIHGDLHLGQALLWGIDFILIDFEGEPDRPLPERREKHSPLKDVAGMLRSFDYVAEYKGDAWATEEWRMRMEEIFLREYLEVADVGSFLPPRETVDGLLRAFRLEKAIYELRYELSHRPDWARIPLAGIRRILFREG